MTHIVDTPQSGDKITEEGIPTDQFQSLLEAYEIAINELAPPSFTVATVPDPAVSEARFIYVSDEAGGATMAFSDGVVWRRTQDRNVIS